MSGQFENNWSATDLDAAASVGNNAHANTSGDLELISAFESILVSPSIMNDGRSSAETQAVLESMKQRIDQWKESDMSAARKKSLPDLSTISNEISPRIPGLMLTRNLGHTMLVMPVFMFSRSSVIEDSENIVNNNLGLGAGLGPEVTLERPPVAQLTGSMLKAVEAKQKRDNAGAGITEVKLVSALIVDLDTIAIANSLNDHAREKEVSEWVLCEWEAGLKLHIAKRMMQRDNKLPAPYLSKDNSAGTAYGTTNQAVARSEGLTEVQYVNGQPLGSNMVTRMRTASKDRRNESNDSTREIVTVYSNVHLNGSPFMAFMPKANAFNQMDMMMYGGLDKFQFGYRPFQPCIVMDMAVAGSQMGNNDGLYSLFMGLWALMTTNNNFLWSEAYRTYVKNSPRGSLVNIDGRIRDLAAGVNNLDQVYNKDTQLTESKIKDMDFLNRWINRNIAGQASLAMDLMGFSKNSGITNILFGLFQPATAQVNKSLLITTLDAMTNGGFTAKINSKGWKGWNESKAIMHRTSTLLPQGTYVHNGIVRSLSEIDETTLYAQCGREDATISTYMRAIYGDGQTDEPIRRARATFALHQILQQKPTLTGFARRHFWDPEFLQLFAEVFANLGELKVAGSTSTVTSALNVFAPGAEYASTANAGSVGTFFNNTGGVVNANQDFSFY